MVEIAMNKVATIDNNDAGVDTLTQKAYRLLEEQIVTLKLSPGTVLSESGIAKTLSIGRTPVREALQRLAAEGLVIILPRRGILVSEINLGQQMLLLEVRRELEKLVAKSAAKRSNADQAERFKLLADGFSEAAHLRDELVFMRLDHEFNKLLLEACHNPFAANSLRAIQGLSRRFWYFHYKQFLDLPRCASLHEAVARAVASGDEDASVAAACALMKYIQEFARATV
jgi:DNA-binding GntR family transcriptional regulator